MKKKNASIASKAMVLALAAASFSFAGPGLADGAAKFVGNITQSNSEPGANDQFTQLWNQATAENGCKWGSVEGSRGNYNWAGCDAAYNWAKHNGGHFKFHALIWGSQYPNWLPNLSKDDTRKAIEDWFKAVHNRYPDAEMIDVANEAIRTGNNQYHSSYTSTKIIDALGGDNGQYTFLTTAFKMARELWPDAILIYNDYNTIQWNVDQGIDLINTIRKNGAPVDAYGLQAHDLMSEGGNGGGTGGGGVCMNYNSFVSTMKKIHEKTNNFPILISEYDVPSTDDGIQKQCVSEQFKYWMEDPVVAGVTFWGYVYGSTWLDCNGKARGCSGLVKNGQDRPAMTWLKDYLSKNKGVNETGLAGGKPVEPEPRQYFKGNPFEIPGKIEMEDFDISGKGKNEDGTSNITYSDSDYDNHSCVDAGKEAECSNYREKDAPEVDLYKKATGVVVGYIQAGEWLEYTINVKEAGDYTFFAAVTSGGGSSFNFTLDGKELTGDIEVPANSDADNYEDYNKVNKNVTLPAGQHVLRFTAVKDWMDIDYITFVKGKDATDPEPIEDKTAVPTAPKYDANVRQAYFVIDPNGVFMGTMSAYGFDAAAQILSTSSEVKSSGVYYLRNRATGETKRVRIVR